MNPPSNIRASPVELSCLYQGLYHVRRLGNCFGRAEQISTGAANFGTFIAGLLLSCACGKNETVRMTARLIMIATKVIATVKAQLAFSRYCEEFLSAFKPAPHLPPYLHVTLERYKHLPLSYQRRMAHMLSRMITLVSTIFSSLLKILYQIVLISTHLLDLAEAIQGKKEIIHQSVRDIFINCSSCWSDTTQIVQELCQYEVQVHHILRFLGGAYESELVSSKILNGCKMGAVACQPFIAIGSSVGYILGFQKSSSQTAQEKEVIL